MARIALFLFALDQFRNKTIDSQRFAVSFFLSLSFSLRTKIGLLDRRMLLVVVRAQVAGDNRRVSYRRILLPRNIV